MWLGAWAVCFSGLELGALGLGVLGAVCVSVVGVDGLCVCWSWVFFSGILARSAWSVPVGPVGPMGPVGAAGLVRHQCGKTEDGSPSSGRQEPGRKTAASVPVFPVPRTSAAVRWATAVLELPSSTITLPLTRIPVNGCTQSNRSICWVSAQNHWSRRLTFGSVACAAR